MSLSELGCFIAALQFCFFFKQGQTITLSGSTNLAVVGKSFTFMCNATIHDSVGVIVFTKDGNEFGKLSYEQGICKNLNHGTPIPCQPETCSCNSNRIYNWTISTVNTGWHRSNVLCYSVFGFTSNKKEIFVAIPFTSVTITPNQRVDLIEGHSVNFTCSTNPASRPSANIEWFMVEGSEVNRIGTNITSQGGSGSLIDQTRVVTSYLKFYPDHTPHTKLVFCRATADSIGSVDSTNITVNVRFCPDGYYGADCNQSCSVMPNCDICNLYTINEPVLRQTLACIKCLPGHTGTNCTESCSVNCKDNVCDITSGGCYLGCKAGFYGDNCNKTCSVGCGANYENVTSCNTTSGVCDDGCLDGFYDSFCDKQCNDDCMTDSLNNTVCDVSTGMCIYGCKPGLFGSNCTNKCSDNCFHDCKQLTGECLSCKGGFYGSSCDNSCNENCSDPTNCDQSYGKCINGCRIGHFGFKCQLCSLNCKANKTCRESDGVCDGCKVGFNGPFCDILCSENCGGDRTCFQNSTCDSGCVPGYFGSNCTELCSARCEPNNTCHHETGYCFGCIDGFFGNQCLQACPINCNTSYCSQSNAHCMHGCKVGMYGNKCTKLCDCSGESCDQNCGICTIQVDIKESEMLTIIVASSIAGFVALMVLIVIAVCMYRRRRNIHGSKPELRRASYDIVMDNVYNQHNIQNNDRHASTDVVRTVVENVGMLINRSKIIDKEIIGRGNFAEVRKGKLVGTQVNEFVAIKTIQALHTPKDFMDFKKELEIIGTIGYHPNVVALKGFCVDETDCIGAVLEYCPNGDLKTYLRKLKAPNDLNDELRTLVYRQFIKFAIDVANGMKHISDIWIIHRDLAARNVLLDGGLIAKVSDFGLSRIQNTYTVKNANVELPLKWMALESLRDMQFTTASDVWSFGVVVWEIYSVGATPFAHECSDNIQIKLDLGGRLQKPEDCDQEIYDLMLECLDSDPNCRPSFTGLYERLVGYMDKIMGDEYQEIKEDKDNYSTINEAVIRDYEKLFDNRRFLPNSEEILQTEVDHKENATNMGILQKNNTTIDNPIRVNEVFKKENSEFAQNNPDGRNPHRDSYITATYDTEVEDDNTTASKDQIDQDILGRRKSHRNSYIIIVPNEPVDQNILRKRNSHRDSYITPTFDSKKEEDNASQIDQSAYINRCNQISGEVNPHRSSYLTAVEVLETGNTNDDGSGNTNEIGNGNKTEGRNGNTKTDDGHKMNGFLSNRNSHKNSYLTPQYVVDTETNKMNEIFELSNIQSNTAWH